MSQHEPNNTRSAIIADLACLVGEVAQIQADQAQLAERQSALQGRLGKMIRDLSQTTAIARPQPAQVATKPAERSASAVQAATPARIPPVAQSEGQPESARKAPDDVSERGSGVVRVADKSGESRHVAGAGGESAASADTAPAADEKKSVNDQQALALEAAIKPDPLVPRRPAQVVPGNGRVQDGGEISRGDQVLDLWANTLLSYDEIAARLKINPSTPSAYVSTARGKGDPRAKQGDEPREKIRYNTAMDAYASTNDTPSQIDRKFGLPAGMTSRFITKAWGDGDQRVKDGEARRRLAPKATTAAAEIAQDRPAIPTDKLLVADVKGCRVVGPAGDWAAPEGVVKAIRVLDDGQLYGLKQITERSGIAEARIIHALPLWTSCLRKIGLDLVYTRHIGCKLNRIAA